MVALSFHLRASKGEDIANPCSAPYSGFISSLGATSKSYFEYTIPQLQSVAASL